MNVLQVLAVVAIILLIIVGELAISSRNEFQKLATDHEKTISFQQSELGRQSEKILIYEDLLACRKDRAELTELRRKLFNIGQDRATVGKGE